MTLKLALVSDIHGNVLALEAALADIEKQFLSGKSARDYKDSPTQMAELKDALKTLASKVEGAGPVKHPKFGKLGARTIKKSA